MFVGRTEQLSILDEFLRRVVDDQDSKPGKALLIRGRRRVGKSRLVEEFLDRAGVPSLFFAASGRPVRDELALFVDEVMYSTLPGKEVFRGIELTSWDAALRLLGSILPDSGSVVVFDEMPYLIDADFHFEGTLQRAFDRELSRKRVLLIGIGSDLAMMEALNEYGRPFHQRASEMVVPPLSPLEVGAMLGLGAADAFDAFMVTGGLPLICSEWETGMSLWEYLSVASSNPTSALLVSAERSLAAEFRAETLARDVLGAIGSGERTFTNIGRASGGRASGGIPPTSLTRALRLLEEKRMVAAELPLSCKPSRERRYRVADPYLRFWLAFLGPYLAEIERGRGDRVLARIRAGWSSWRGRAIEPVVREALERLSPSFPLGAGAVPGAGEVSKEAPKGVPKEAPKGASKEARAVGLSRGAGFSGGVPGVVGGYWTRTNSLEIDIVVADRAPVAKRILAVGSIKWLENAPFDAHDAATLHVHRSQLPGATPEAQLVAVARSGCTADGVVHISPEDLLQAYGR